MLKRLDTLPIDLTGPSAFQRHVAQMDQQFTNECERFYDGIGCPVTVLRGQWDREPLKPFVSQCLTHRS